MSQMLMLAILTMFVALRVMHASRKQDDAGLALILIGAALVRICTGLVNHYMGPLPGARIDAVMFDEVARNLALVPAGPTHLAVQIGKMGYSSILATFYFISGYHFFIPTLVNLVFTIEFLVIVYTLAREMGDVRAARVTVAFAAFYPTSILYTAVPLREAPLLLGLALYVQGLFQYFSGTGRLLQWRLFVGLGMLIWLHDGFALAIFLIPIVMWFRNDHVSVWRRAAYVGLGVAVMLAVFVIAVNTIDFRKMPSDPTMLLDPAYLARMRETKAAYGMSYGIVEPTWSGIIKAAPLLVFAFVAAPFPIWWERVSDLPKVAEGLLSLLLVIGACVAVYSLRRAGRGARSRLLLSMFLYLVVVFSMGTGNTGIAARHRAKFVWMPIMLCSAAYFRVGARAGPERRPWQHHAVQTAFRG